MKAVYLLETGEPLGRSALGCALFVSPAACAASEDADPWRPVWWAGFRAPRTCDTQTLSCVPPMVRSPWRRLAQALQPALLPYWEPEPVLGKVGTSSRLL